MATKTLLNIDDVCALLGVSKPWVYNAVRQRHIPSVKIVGKLRFDPDVLDEWIAAQRREAS